MTDQEAAALGREALAEVTPGAVVGLGTGQAATAFIHALGQAVKSGLRVTGVPTSEASAKLARTLGIPLIAEPTVLDVAVDGADEVDPALNLLKGGGGALLREKLVIAAARHVVIVAESPKLVPHLGATKALPVEVVRFAWPTTRSRVLDLLPTATLRPTPDGSPFVTDEGHHLLDCALPATDLPTLATALKSTLGVVEHGLFTDQADEVLVGNPDGTVQTLHR